MTRCGWGFALAAMLTLIACGDPGLPDGGAVLDDAGISDGGSHDGGSSDGGANDGGANDGGANDGGANDGGANDGGATDAGANDAGVSDAGPSDAGQSDAGQSDAGQSDAGADAGVDAGPMCGSCDDGNPCTTDRCTASGCVHDDLDGTSCSDANACTTPDVCVAGTCVGATTTCAAPTACRLAGTCNPSTGQCAYPLAPANTGCDDASNATHTDVCSSQGVCAGTPVACPTSDACITYTPNGTATCTATRHDGVTCEDANACTPTGTCSNGTCVVGAPISCANGGTCAGGGCSCTSAWSGPTCGTDVNECGRFACGGGSNCTNSPGSYSCQCMTNYGSPTGANCTSTVATLEIVLFYDESVVQLYGEQTRARLAAIFQNAKVAYDTSLTPPPFTLSLNAMVRVEPLPSALTMRACNTLMPSTNCLGCYQGGSSMSCGTLVSNSATEIDTDQFLNAFRTWIGANRASLEAKVGVFDVPVFVTAADFAGSVAGLATVSGACRSQGVATISLSRRQNELGAGMVLAHELGHTVGMSHDAAGASFIMAPSSSPTAPPTSFSSASLAAYQTWRNNLGAANCINDFAQHDWMVRNCGNGIVEQGEACDPGVANDSCCVSCQLAAGCQCANSEPCCSAGAPRPAGTACRASRGECDLADTCDGISSTCRDQFKSPRDACSGNGLCLWGACASRTAQCRAAAPVGSGFENANGCETSTRCDRLDCATNMTCDFFWNLIPADGTRCGTTSQCASGLCVASGALKVYDWVPGAWSTCAGGTQTRPLRCVDEAGTTATDAMCDPDTRPSTSRGCP